MIYCLKEHEAFPNSQFGEDARGRVIHRTASPHYASSGIRVGRRKPIPTGRRRAAKKSTAKKSTAAKKTTAKKSTAAKKTTAKRSTAAKKSTAKRK
jgi:DNA-binding protein HU-beta